MIVALLLAAAAITLLALATPRQAEVVFGRAVRRVRLVRLRRTGWGLLGVSLILAVVRADSARHLIVLVTGISLFALLAALAFTLIGARRR